MNNIPDDLKLVTIGASAGGISAFHEILPAFRGKKVAVLVVLHLPPAGPNLIPSLFQDSCEFKIKEAESGESIEPGKIYIAPPGYHLSAEPNGTLSLSNEEEVNFSRPSIDILFESVAFAYKKTSMGILLTGANHDGSRGLNLIRDCGGITVVQDPKSAEYPVMPQSAIALFRPDFVLNLAEIAGLVGRLR